MRIEIEVEPVDRVPGEGWSVLLMRDGIVVSTHRVTDADWPIESPAIEDEPYDEGYYYSGTGEHSSDDSYIDYLNRF